MADTLDSSGESMSKIRVLVGFASCAVGQGADAEVGRNGSEERSYAKDHYVLVVR
jgi:hypothetical protein